MITVITGCFYQISGIPTVSFVSVLFKSSSNIPLFFLCFTDVGSSLQDLAGNWNFVINTVDVIENSTEMPESKLWQDNVEMSHFVSISDASAGCEDRLGNCCSRVNDIQS